MLSLAHRLVQHSGAESALPPPVRTQSQSPVRASRKARVGVGMSVQCPPRPLGALQTSIRPVPHPVQRNRGAQACTWGAVEEDALGGLDAQLLELFSVRDGQHHSLHQLLDLLVQAPDDPVVLGRLFVHLPNKQDGPRQPGSVVESCRAWGSEASSGLLPCMRHVCKPLLLSASMLL